MKSLEARLMEERMMEVLNRTLRARDRISKSRNRKLADKVFEEFMAQKELVEYVTGKVVDLIETEDGSVAVFRGER